QFAAVLARIQHHLPVALAQLAMLRALLPGLHRQILRGGVVALPQRALGVFAVEGTAAATGAVATAEVAAASAWRSGARDSNFCWYSSVICLASSLLRMMRGVISTISSVRSRLRLVLPNRRPMTGIRLRPGMPVSVLPSSCWIRPPSSTVCPLCTATCVLSWRCEMDGLPLTIGCDASRWLTCWLTFMYTRPPGLIRGCTFRI